MWISGFPESNRAGSSVNIHAQKNRVALLWSEQSQRSKEIVRRIRHLSFYEKVETFKFEGKKAKYLYVATKRFFGKMRFRATVLQHSHCTPPPPRGRPPRGAHLASPSRIQVAPGLDGAKSGRSEVHAHSFQRQAGDAGP